jgi:hypothetical protein
MQRWVRANVRSTPITPERDAQAAASNRKWALIGPGGAFGTSRVGVDCNLSTPMGDDMPIPCSQLMGDQSCEMKARLSDYTLRFNRSLVTHPAYPYRDICRVQSNAKVESPYFATQQRELGFPDLLDTGRPRDVFEAARRGNMSFLQAAYRADPASIQARDIFNMSVAEWAVRYRHAEVVKWLVSHGAGRVHQQCDDIYTNSLLARAIFTGQDDLALWLSNAMPPRMPWDSWLIEAVARNNMPRMLAKVLAERNDGIRFNTEKPSFPLSPPTKAVIDQAVKKLCEPTGLHDDTVIDVLDIDLHIDVNKPGSDQIDIVYPNSRNRVIVLLNGGQTRLQSVWKVRPRSLRFIRMNYDASTLSWPGDTSPPLDFIFQQGLTTACPPAQEKIYAARSKVPNDVRAAIAAVFGKVPVEWHSIRNNHPVQLAE